jgi:hypothetical protein
MASLLMKLISRRRGLRDGDRVLILASALGQFKRVARANGRAGPDASRCG